MSLTACSVVLQINGRP